MLCLHYIVIFFGRLFGKLLKVTQLRLAGLPVRPHGTTQLPLEGFSLNSIFEYFSKIYRQESFFF